MNSNNALQSLIAGIANVTSTNPQVQLLAQGVLTVMVADSFPLDRAAAALAQARHGAHGSATVLQPSGGRHAASRR